jgi:hypothetical protein
MFKLGLIVKLECIKIEFGLRQSKEESTARLLIAVLRSRIILTERRIMRLRPPTPLFRM